MFLLNYGWQGHDFVMKDLLQPVAVSVLVLYFLFTISIFSPHSLPFCYFRETKETTGRRETQVLQEQPVLQGPGAPQERMEPKAML